MSQRILQDYWNDRSVIRREAARSGNASLAERLAWQDVIRRHMGSGRGLRVLDVGSGCGVLPQVIASMKHRFTAVDQSIGLLEVGRQRADEAKLKGQFVQSDVAKLDFANAAFDVVTAVNVISTLSRPRAALAEWARVLKPGGHLILVEDDRTSAEFPAFHKHQLRNSPSPLEQAYQQTLETVPLWLAQPNEIEAVLKLDDWQDVVSHPALGQLVRRGRFGLTNYAVGYHVTAATKPGSIRL